jgi:hypothetical protein
MADASRHEAMSVFAFDRCHAHHREPMSLRTRLLLTVILAVFLGCHAYVAFIVLPPAHPDWQKSDLTHIGDGD